MLVSLGSRDKSELGACFLSGAHSWIMSRICDSSCQLPVYLQSSFDIIILPVSIQTSFYQARGGEAVFDLESAVLPHSPQRQLCFPGITPAQVALWPLWLTRLWALSLVPSSWFRKVWALFGAGIPISVQLAGGSAGEMEMSATQSCHSSANTWVPEIPSLCTCMYMGCVSVSDTQEDFKHAI